MGTVKRLISGFAVSALFASAGLGAPRGDARLVAAAERSDPTTVRALLARHADINSAQADGSTALHWAVRHDDLEMADLLLRAGADVSAETRYHATPLYLAATIGSAALIEKLLDAGADPNSANPEGETALMTAVRTGKIDAVRLLLDRGSDINAREGQRQQTALMWAVVENHHDVVQLLAERGAGLDAQSAVYMPPGLAPPPRIAGASGAGVARQRAVPTASGKMTALLFAAREGRAGIAKTLVEAGADIQLATANNTSPLLIAILNHKIRLASYLLEQGADPNALDDYGRGPLFAAVENRNFRESRHPYYEPDGGDPTELIQALIAKGADVNQRAKTVPFPMAFMQGDYSYVNFDGQTPFLRAALSGDIWLMRYLLEHGADPNIGTERGATPLMAAAGLNVILGQTKVYSEEERLEAIRLCLEHGADINAANSEGFTAMHAAANKGWLPVIQLLADNGSHLDWKDKEGRTPMTFAHGVFLATLPPEKKPETIALLNKLMAEASGTPEPDSGSAGGP